MDENLLIESVRGLWFWFVVSNVLSFMIGVLVTLAGLLSLYAGQAAAKSPGCAPPERDAPQ